MAQTESGLQIPDHLAGTIGNAQSQPSESQAQPEHRKFNPVQENAEQSPIDKEATEELGNEPRYAKQLPDPRGVTMLIALPEIKELSDGGIYRGREEVRADQVSSICGFVIALGDDCYANKLKFPNGPWCQQGDWVLFQAYSGTRFTIHGKEFRLINDTSVQAVVEDPRGVSKLL